MNIGSDLRSSGRRRAPRPTAARGRTAQPDPVPGHRVGARCERIAHRRRWPPRRPKTTTAAGSGSAPSPPRSRGTPRNAHGPPACHPPASPLAGYVRARPKPMGAASGPPSSAPPGRSRDQDAGATSGGAGTPQAAARTSGQPSPAGQGARECADTARERGAPRVRDGQPVLDVPTRRRPEHGAALGLEALVRRDHPTRRRQPAQHLSRGPGRRAHHRPQRVGHRRGMSRAPTWPPHRPPVNCSPGQRRGARHRVPCRRAE